MTNTNAPGVKLLALDVDGVLTDGGIYVDESGREFKRYDVTDGFGIKLWQKMGFTVAIVTGRTGDAVLHRAAYLGIQHVIMGSRDKAESLKELERVAAIAAPQIAFLGDDWPDLSILRRVGYPMAVANAAPPVKDLAAFVTSRAGGRGACREAVEHLLGKKGLLDRALALYDAKS